MRLPALLVGVSFLCGLNYAQPLTGLESSTAAEIDIRAAGTTGCGKAYNWAGSTRIFTIKSSGGDRTLNIHLPSNYNKDDPRGLIVAYHGRGQTSDKMEKDTKFSDTSINPNMIAVYPQGVNKAWSNAEYATPGVDDKVFTTDLVNFVKNNFCVNPNRIYATGFSNGGGMVGSLACANYHGSHFAAFAPIAAALYNQLVSNNDGNCNPSRIPTPIMEVHGTADNTILYNGGSTQGGQTPVIRRWVERWAMRDKCDMNSKKVLSLANNVEHWQWTCSGQSYMVQHYMLNGWSHVWPGSVANSPIDISPVIVKFFDNHPKQ